MTNNVSKMYYSLEWAPRPIAEKGAQAFEKLEPCIKPYTRGETVDYGAILGVALLDPRICSLRNLSIKPRRSAPRPEAASRHKSPIGATDMKDPAKKPPSATRAAVEEKLDEEIEESFPASDPPANTPTSAGGPQRPQAKKATKGKPGRRG